MLKFTILFVASCILFHIGSVQSSFEDQLNVWEPVSDGLADLTQVGETLLRSSASGSAESQESLIVRCPAPNNGGLHPLLREIRPLIPADRIEHIVHSALKWDPQMRSLQQLVRTPNFRTNVRLLRISPEFSQLRSIACHRMYLDLNYYAKFVRTLFHVKTSPDSMEMWDSDEAIFNGRPGFVGLCQDIIDTLPRTQLRDVYRRRIQSDVDLSSAIDFMRSAEFRQILRDIGARQEYQDIKGMINAIGIRLEDLKKVINYAMGRDEQQYEAANEELIYLLTL